jgi:hypothetical protein
MTRYTLSKVFQHGFALSDIDLLVKHKRASFGSQNGKTTVSMNVNDCWNFLDDYFRRW